MDNKNKETTTPDDANTSYDKYIDPNYQKKQKKKKMLIIAISAITALVIISIVALIAFSLSSDNQGEVVDSSDTTISVHDCTVDEACFNDYFLLCQPARYQANEPQGDKITYEIMGIQNVGCLVSIRYDESIDSEIVGKEMTCDFDNDLDFRASLAMVNEYTEDHECAGSLIDFYNSLVDEVNTIYGT